MENFTESEFFQQLKQTFKYVKMSRLFIGLLVFISAVFISHQIYRAEDDTDIWKNKSLWEIWVGNEGVLMFLIKLVLSTAIFTYVNAKAPKWLNKLQEDYMSLDELKKMA